MTRFSAIICIWTISCSVPCFIYVSANQMAAIQTLEPQLVFFSDINLAGKRLAGYTSKTVKVESLQACFEECSKTKPLHCKSLNYEKLASGHGSTHSCELNTKTKNYDHSKNFVVNGEYIYYEVIA